MQNSMSVLVGPGRADYLKEMFPPGHPITPGDTKLMWSSDKPDEVDAARTTFDKLVAKGYVAFRAEGKDGHQGEKITKFDPEAERIILIPRMQGG